MITSLHNPAVRQVVRLRQRRHRDATGLMLVEGCPEIALALGAGVVIERLFCCEALLDPRTGPPLVAQAQGRGAAVAQVTEAVYARMAFGDRQEGLLAVAQQPRPRLPDLALGPCPLLVAIESVEKPGNLGALLRTADAAGVDAVLVCDPNTDLYNPNVVRASLGTIFTVPLAVTTGAEATAWLREHGVAILAATPAGAVDYTAADLARPICFVLGSEHAGLSEPWLRHADLRLRIPMRGRADSLNVSVAAAVLLFEALRQRNRRSRPEG